MKLLLYVSRTNAHTHTHTIAKSKFATGSQTHKHKWHKFPFAVENIEKYLPLCFPTPFELSAKKWKIGRLFIIIAAFLIYIFFSARFSFFFTDFRILFSLILIFLCTFLFVCTLFECHICLLAGIVTTLLPLIQLSLSVSFTCSMSLSL